MPIQTLKRRVYQWITPSWTVGALAVIGDENGKVCLVKHRGRRFPWSLPGGLIKWPETPVQALCRELHEELGLVLAPNALALKEGLSSERYALLDLVFAYEKPLPVELAASIRPQSWEITEIRWVSADELPFPGGMLERHALLLKAFFSSRGT